MTAKDKYQNKLNWTILFIISSAFITTELNMQGFLSLMPFIQEEFVITRTEVGLYSSFYFLSATLIAIFSGRIVDIIGFKKGLVFSIFAVGILMMLHAVVPFYTLILTLAFITGLCFSLITPSVSKAIMELINPENRAVSMGVIHAGGGIGGFIGAGLLPVLAKSFGWRRALLFPGLLAILLGLFVLKYYQHRNKTAKKKDENHFVSFKNDLKLLLKNRYMLCVCCLGFAFGSAIGAIPAHFTLYLTKDLGLNTTIAGLGFGLLQIGSVVGKPGWGWVNDRFFKGNRRMGLLTIALLIIIVCCIIGLLEPVLNFNLPVIFILALILGATGMSWPGLHFTLIAELASEEHTGTATGISLIFSRMGVVFAPPLFGYIADLTGDYGYSWLFLAFILLLFSSLFYWYTGKLR